MISICIQIYFARILDVSLNTIRTFYTLKGKTIFSTVISFFEVLIWFIVARQALNVNLNSIWIPISYALGYSTGNLIGSYISNNFIKTSVNINVITEKNNSILFNALCENNYKFSILDLNNNYDKIKRQLLIINTNKKNLKNLYKIVYDIDKNSYVYISDVKMVQKEK